MQHADHRRSGPPSGRLGGGEPGPGRRCWWIRLSPLTATVLDDQGTPMDGAAVSVEQQRRPRSRQRSMPTASSPPHPGHRDDHRDERRRRAAAAEVSVSFGEGTLTNLTYCTIGGVRTGWTSSCPAHRCPGRCRWRCTCTAAAGSAGERSSGTRFTALKETLLARGYPGREPRLSPGARPQVSRPDSGREMRHPSSALAGVALWPGSGPDRSVGRERGWPAGGAAGDRGRRRRVR